MLKRFVLPGLRQYDNRKLITNIAPISLATCVLHSSYLDYVQGLLQYMMKVLLSNLFDRVGGGGDSRDYKCAEMWSSKCESGSVYLKVKCNEIGPTLLLR